METLNFNHAIEIHQEVKEKKKVENKKLLQEFLESKCDLFSYQDFLYYSEKTGKSIQWLWENAKYSDSEGCNGTLLENAIIDEDYELAEMFI